MVGIGERPTTGFNSGYFRYSMHHLMPATSFLSSFIPLLVARICNPQCSMHSMPSVQIPKGLSTGRNVHEDGVYMFEKSINLSLSGTATRIES